MGCTGEGAAGGAAAAEFTGPAHSQPAQLFLRAAGERWESPAPARHPVCVVMRCGSGTIVAC